MNAAGYTANTAECVSSRPLAGRLECVFRFWGVQAAAASRLGATSGCSLTQTLRPPAGGDTFWSHASRSHSVKPPWIAGLLRWRSELISCE